MSQFYSLKAVIEQVLGHKAYLNVKETSSLAAWIRESERLFKAVELAHSSTVTIADDDWHEQFQELIAHGRSLIHSSKNIAELFSYLSATLIRIVFLQIGMVPQRSRLDTVPLRPSAWLLDSYRTVQYVQTEQQKQNAKHASHVAPNQTLQVTSRNLQKKKRKLRAAPELRR